MAWVVCLILVAQILLSISVLGLYCYSLKVRQNSKAAAGIQSLNGLWQVFSCFSQLTSCSHTAIKWIGHELHHMMPTVIKDWTFFSAQSCHACPWLYRLLYRHFRSVCPSIWGLLVLTSAVRHFLACLVMEILETTDYNIAIDVTV